MTPWLAVVGLGEDGLAGLTPTARTLIETAEVLVGGERHHALVPDHVAERLSWRRPLQDTVADIAARRGRRVTVLATGDPMSYGIGVTLGRTFAVEEMTIVPAPGAFSLACARLGWPLQEVTCLTLHGRPLETLNLHLAPGARLMLMSEDGDTPACVAEALVSLGYGDSRLVVLEHMGGPAESQHCGIARDWTAPAGAALNTIAVTCVAGPDATMLSRMPGLPDAAFAHDGQLTKRVVRAATLAALAPLPGQGLWDIGAGCGSVGIEWLRAVARARAQAVERDPGRCALIARNAQRLGVPQLDIVTGEALALLDRLDAPDAVFVGGGGSEPDLIPACVDALATAGRLVANAVTVACEAVLLEQQQRFGGTLTRIAVSQAEPMGTHLGWRALAPVTQWAWTKR